MIALLLTILFTVVLFLLFKEFSKRDIDTRQAITFNYITASFLGYLFHPDEFKINQIIESDWLIPTTILGACFILIFNLMAITTQKLGIAIGSMSAKMSLIIPVIGAYLFQKEVTISTIQFFGILLALLSVYLTFKNNDKKTTYPITIAIILFFGAGILDSILNFIQNQYLESITDFSLFIITVFFIASLIGIMQIIVVKSNFHLKNVFAGMSLGIPNYLSIYFTLESLEELGGIIVFPALNIGVVLISAIISWKFYKEQMSQTNWLGVILACISIFLVLLF